MIGNLVTSIIYDDIDCITLDCCYIAFDLFFLHIYPICTCIFLNFKNFLFMILLCVMFAVYVQCFGCTLMIEKI